MIEMSIYSCCLVGLLFLIFYIIYKFINARKLPPGPYSLPVLGYLPFLQRTNPHFTFTDLSKKYGSIYGLYLGNIYTVVITDSQMIRQALKLDNFTARAPLYITHGIMGGYGLICAEGDRWLNQRKLTIDWLKLLGMIKNGLARHSMENRIMKGVLEFNKLIADEIALDNPINPTNPLLHTLGNILNDCIFGKTYDINDTTWLYLQHLQEEGVKYIGVSGLVNFLPILRFLPLERKIINFLLTGKEKTHQIYKDIVYEIEREFRRQRTITNTNELTIDSSEQCIVALFLNERLNAELIGDHEKLQFYCDDQLYHLLADLFGAGLDTTATTIRWFLLFISINTDAQRKIHEEMNQYSIASNPLLEHCDNLNYLKACIAETQRIRSVVPLGIPHGVKKSTNFCGYVIPKNSMIIPLQWALHMNPETWNNPEDFCPERFITEDGKFYAPKEFLPFQSGKRMCLGDELAKMILLLYASNILYKYEIILAEPPINMHGVCGITLTPFSYKLKFKNRVF